MNEKKLKRFKRKAFRDAFVSANIDQGLAHQIRAIRESRGWDQKALATKIGLRSQSAIARMEDPSYGKLSIATLKRLGKAFDVALLVKFVPYSRLFLETHDLSTSALAVKAFDDEVDGLQSDIQKLNQYQIFTTSAKRSNHLDAKLGNSTTQYIRVADIVPARQQLEAGYVE